MPCGVLSRSEIFSGPSSGCSIARRLAARAAPPQLTVVHPDDEEIRFARIVWKRPLGARFIALYDRAITNLRYPVQYVSLALLVGMTAQDPRVLLRMLTGMGLVALLNMLYYLRSERSLDFVYGALYTYFAAFTLFWIFPYAAVTVRARAWLTR
ncbi:MAG TPA: hypothetical protein VJN88_03850 [Ktedonobacterales bacterium]|nr:hypothetical protein [Ktedonobacterales bacterium]